LLTEADRARTQGTPLSLTILQIDRGANCCRQQGESPMEKFLEQLRGRCSDCAQNDVGVKYTSWSLALFCRTRLWRALRFGGQICGAPATGIASAVGCDGR